MDVIGAGFGRTGTLSLKASLERLGFAPCYHVVEAPRGEPFPHLNEGERFPELMRDAILSELVPKLGKAAAVSSVVALVLWALGRGLPAIHPTA